MNSDQEPKPKVIVRVRTSHLATKQGARYCREVFTLRRKSEGFDFWEEEIQQVGADLALEKIHNLFDVSDGIYQLIMVNKSTDWETGYVDDWDLELIPYDESISGDEVTRCPEQFLTGD